MSEQNELKRLAELANSPNWQRGTAGDANVVSYNGEDIVGVCRAYCESRADFIAAANPSAILKLLDRIEALECIVSDKPKQEPVALRLFVGASFPVSTDIDKRGYRWSESYLDQARAAALAARGGAKPDTTTVEQIRDAALEEAAAHFDTSHRELWCPEIAEEIRALISREST